MNRPVGSHGMHTTLPDILEGGLDIVFVGINPGLRSSKAGHYYANPSNRFWPLLYKSGLLPRPLKPGDDWKLPRFRLGLTDMVKRVSAGSADLSSDEFTNGAGILTQKIRFYRPGIICFNGLVAYRTFFPDGNGAGQKVDLVAGSRLFVIPSTSPRNASYSDDRLLDYFLELARFRAKVCK